MCSGFGYLVEVRARLVVVSKFGRVFGRLSHERRHPTQDLMRVEKFIFDSRD